MQSNFHHQRPKENHLCQQIPRWIDDFDQTNYAKDVVNRTAQRSICICNNVNMNVGWKWGVNVSFSVASGKPLTLRQEHMVWGSWQGWDLFLDDNPLFTQATGSESGCVIGCVSWRESPIPCRLRQCSTFGPDDELRWEIGPLFCVFIFCFGAINLSK